MALDKTLSDQDIVEFKEAFSFLDVNGDGFIDKHELRDFLKSLKLNTDMLIVDEMMEEIDSTYSDVNQTIDFSEFLTWMAKIYGSMSVNDVQNIFNFFDTNGNGFISENELRRVLQNLAGKIYTDEDIKHMIQDVDTTGTGKISFADFQVLMLGVESQQPIDSAEFEAPQRKFKKKRKKKNRSR